MELENDFPRDDRWQIHAACAGHEHPEWWFPEKGDQLAARQAKAVCADCPVKADCRAAGMGEHFGIWGGLAEKARRDQRRREERRCDVCGDVFVGRMSDRTCGERCRRQLDRIRNRETRRRQRGVGELISAGHGTTAVALRRGEDQCNCQACKACRSDRARYAVLRREAKAS